MEYKYDIHERIYKYVLSVLMFVRKISKTYENQILLQQILRSITSIGANDQEADGALTKADFIHCYVIVRKELKESLYWIRLFADLNKNMQTESVGLLQEGDEILKIITTIIFKTRNNNK